MNFWSHGCWGAQRVENHRALCTPLLSEELSKGGRTYYLTVSGEHRELQQATSLLQTSKALDTVASGPSGGFLSEPGSINASRLKAEQAGITYGKQLL